MGQIRRKIKGSGGNDEIFGGDGNDQILGEMVMTSLKGKGDDLFG